MGAEIDLRVGGSARYTYRRPSGRTLEVCNQFQLLEAPHRLAYLESYDFSPITILVTTTFDEHSGRTLVTQTLEYPSQQERDDDFASVSSGANEVYPQLAEYLGAAK